MVLFSLNMSDYYKYYRAIAIQERYLVPLLPMIVVFSLLSINYMLRKSRALKLTVLVIFFALYLNGAGLVTHIVRSDESWNWDNQTIRQVNDKARDLLTPFVKERWY